MSTEKVNPHTLHHATHPDHDIPASSHHPVGQVHARFQLTQRSDTYFHQPDTEGGETERVEGVYVHLSAVKGQPFGLYTPNGCVQMAIASPSAAALFKNAELGTEFDVLFTPVHGEHKA